MNRRNAEYATPFTDFAEGVSAPQRFLLADAMTSGGLLVAVPPERSGDAPGVRIGTITQGAPGEITVL